MRRTFRRWWRVREISMQGSRPIWPVLKLVDDKLAILLLPDQALGNLPLMQRDRSIMLDAPYHEAAYDQIDHHQRHSCKIGPHVAEIDGRTERAPQQGSRDPDPITTERGSKEYGRNIWREKYVRPDQGKAPPRRGRQGEAGGCKSNAEKQRWLRCSVPASPKLVDQFQH